MHSQGHCFNYLVGVGYNSPDTLYTIEKDAEIPPLPINANILLVVSRPKEKKLNVEKYSIEYKLFLLSIIPVFNAFQYFIYSL